VYSRDAVLTAARVPAGASRSPGAGLAVATFYEDIVGNFLHDRQCAVIGVRLVWSGEPAGGEGAVFSGRAVATLHDDASVGRAVALSGSTLGEEGLGPLVPVHIESSAGASGRGARTGVTPPRSFREAAAAGTAALPRAGAPQAQKAAASGWQSAGRADAAARSFPRSDGPSRGGEEEERKARPNRDGAGLRAAGSGTSAQGGSSAAGGSPGRSGQTDRPFAAGSGPEGVSVEEDGAPRKRLLLLPRSRPAEGDALPEGEVAASRGAAGGIFGPGRAREGQEASSPDADDGTSRLVLPTRGARRAGTEAPAAVAASKPLPVSLGGPLPRSNVYSALTEEEP
jgi:hypothetical protein